MEIELTIAIGILAVIATAISTVLAIERFFRGRVVREVTTETNVSGLSGDVASIKTSVNSIVTKVDCIEQKVTGVSRILEQKFPDEYKLAMPLHLRQDTTRLVRPNGACNPGESRR